MKQWLGTHWLTVLAIVLVLGAIVAGAGLIPSPPYAYYQLMNWAVVGASVMTAHRAHMQMNSVIMWIFVALAVVFNPLAPLYLRADVWIGADVLAIVLFLFSFVLVRTR